MCGCGGCGDGGEYISQRNYKTKTKNSSITFAFVIRQLCINAAAMTSTLSIFFSSFDDRSMYRLGTGTEATAVRSIVCGVVLDEQSKMQQPLRIFEQIERVMHVCDNNSRRCATREIVYERCVHARHACTLCT